MGKGEQTMDSVGLLDPMREWLWFDWLYLGLMLIVFSSGIAQALIIVWDRLHPSPIEKFNTWLKGE